MNFKMEDLIPIVAKLTEKYTSKESSSVTYDTARMLMDAVIYCIHEGEHSDQYNPLNSKPFNVSKDQKDAMSAYELGYQLVLQKVMTAKELYNSFAEEFESYGNECYQDTVIKGMPSFFLYYDPKFKPQNHLLTLDYPTLNSLNSLQGIDAIYQYLQYISYEQTFMSKFPYDKIDSLLLRYHKGYKYLIMNLCSLVLRNAIACMMVHKEISALEISRDDLLVISGFITSNSKESLEDKISHLIQTLVQYGYENNSALYHYLILDVKDFTAELFHAQEFGCLNVIFGV